jgi:2-oxoglutarate ferredoxin oxidoreductase subunit beta
LYMDPDSQELHENIDSAKKPLRGLTESDLCPGSKVLDNINESLR